MTHVEALGRIGYCEESFTFFSWIVRAMMGGLHSSLFVVAKLIFGIFFSVSGWSWLYDQMHACV